VSDYVTVVHIIVMQVRLSSVICKLNDRLLTYLLTCL